MKKITPSFLFTLRQKYILIAIELCFVYSFTYAQQFQAVSSAIITKHSIGFIDYKENVANVSTPVTVTAPSLTDVCVNSAHKTLGDIVISENGTATNFGIGNFQSIVLSVPAPFFLNPSVGTVSVVGSDVTSASVFITNTSVILLYNVVSVSNVNTITIRGLQVRANAISSNVNITQTSGNAILTGLPAGTSFGLLTSVPQPAAPVITNGNNQNFCLNTPANTTTLTVTGGINNVRWFSDATLTNLLYVGTTPTLANLGVNTSVTGTKQIYLVNRDSGCRSNVVNLSINITPVPVVFVSSSVATNQICQGQTITYTATSNVSLYSFDVKQGGVSLAGFPTTFSSTNSYTLSNTLLPNNYTVEVSVRDNVTNCITVAPPINVTVLPIPNVTFDWSLIDSPSIASNGSIMYLETDNTNINLPVGVSPAGGTFSGTGITGNTFNPSIAGIGIHTLVYSYTAVNGCVNSASVVIIVNPDSFGLRNAQSESTVPYAIKVETCAVTNPIAYGAANPAAIIGGTPLRFDASQVSIPSGDNHAFWSGQVDVADAGMGVCSFAGAYVIFTYVTKDPTPVITAPLGGTCVNQTATYSVTPVANNTTITNGTLYGNPFTATSVRTESYQWSVTGGVIVGSNTGSSVQVLWTTPGAGTIRITETANYAFTQNILFAAPSFNTFNTASQTLSITVNSSPATNVIGQGSMNSLCLNATGNVYSITPNAGSSYVWGVSGGTIVGSNTGNSIDVTWDRVGSANVFVTETNLNGCANTSSLMLMISNRPSPIIVGNIGVCANSSVVYSTINSGNTYNWVVVGGNIVSGQSTNQITVDWGTGSSGSVEVTETNAGGCTQVITQNVIINPLPVPIISGNNMVCVNSTGNSYAVAILANTYTWSVTGGVITGGAGTNNITVTWGTGTAGTVNVTVQDTNGCTSAVSVMNVTINALPSPTIAGLSVVCANTTGVMYSVPNVVGDSYTWVVSGGSITTGQNTHQITVNWGSGSGSVQLTQVNANGCSSIASQAVTLQALPTPAITGANVVCEQATGVVYQTPAETGASYFWSISGGTIVSGQNTRLISVNWGTTGVGVLTVQQTNVATCVATNTYNVTINALPTPVIVGNLSNICANSVQTYQTAAVLNHSYIWSVTGGTIQTGAGTHQITVLWGVAGAGSISLIQQNTLTTCSQTVSNNTLVINSLPTPNISGTTSICQGAKNVVYSVSSVMGNNYNWVVSGGLIVTGQGTNSITVDWGFGLSGSVQITQTNPTTTCSAVQTMGVVIEPLPTPNVIANVANTYCQGGTGDVFSTASAANRTYIWVVSGGTITAGQGTRQITVSWITPGNAQVIVSETNTLTNCNANSVLSVIINARPNPNIAGDAAVCNNQSGVNYNTTFNTGNSYAWVVSGGTITSGQGTSSINVTWGVAGTGTVQVTETNPSNCSTVATRNVTINASPIPNIIGAMVVCANATNVIYRTTSVGIYNWGVMGGTIISGNGTNQIEVNWGAGVSGTVTINVTDVNGCSAPIATSIGVTINPLPNPVISGLGNVCESERNVVYSVPMATNRSYIWAVSGGFITSGQGTRQVIINWGVANPSASVSITEINNSTGCRNTDSRSVNIRALPNVTIMGNDVVCAASSHTYQTGMIGVHNWSVIGGTITSGQGTNTIQVNWQSSGTGFVNLTFTDAFGCSNTITNVITINPLPSPTIIGNVLVCANSENVPYFVNNITGSSYNWVVTGGTIASGQGSSAITVNWGNGTSGSITVTQTNILAGCTQTVSQSIALNPLPTPTILGNTSVCKGATGIVYSTPLTANRNYIWGIENGSITNVLSANQIVVNWSNTVNIGKIILTEQNTLTGCTNKIEENITINDLPFNTIIASVATNVCQEAVVGYSSLDQANMIYQWAVTGTAAGTIISGQSTSNIQVRWTSAGTSTVTLTQINTLTNCSQSFNTTVVVNPLPNPIILGKLTGICEQTLENYQAPLVNNHSYSWSVVGGTIIFTSENEMQVRWDAPGVGSISLIQTSNTTNCSTIITRDVVINPKPAPLISTSSPVICAGQQDAVYTVVNLPDRSYRWFIEGGLLISGQNTNTISVDWGFGASGSVRVVETIISSGCFNENVMPIIINPLPDPVITATKEQSICVNDTDTYTVPNVSGHTYTWSVGGGVIISGQNTHQITVRWGNSSIGNIILTQVSPQGCQEETQMIITLVPLPTPAIIGNGGNLNVCSRKDYIYETAPVTGHNYNWSIINGSITAGQGTNKVTIVWNEGATTGQLLLTQTSNTLPACSEEAILTTNIFNQPNAVITGLTQVCENTTNVRYAVANVLGDTYKWNITGGTIIGSDIGNEVIVNWTTAGTGVVTITQTTTLTQCQNVVSVNVTINPLPNPVITTNAPTGFTICSDSEHIYSVNNVTGHDYTWQVTPEGSIISGQGTNSVRIKWGVGVSATLMLTQKNNATGCESTKLVAVNILAAPNPFIIGNITVCQDDIVNYTTAPTFGAGGNLINTYNWSVPANAGIIVSGQGTNAIQVRWLDTFIGNAVVSLLETSPLGCATAVNRAINVQYKPKFTISYSNRCSGDNTTFNTNAINANPQGIVPVFSWRFHDNSTGTGSSLTKVYNTPGNYTVQLDIATPQGCTFSVVKIITIHPKPITNFTFAGLCLGSVTQFNAYIPNNRTLSFVDTPTGANDELTQWEWDFGDGTPVVIGSLPNNNPNITHNFSTAGTYNVRLRFLTNNGCSSEITKQVIIFGAKAPNNANPYVEAFDANDGGWVARSLNANPTSWGWGVPASNRTVKNAVGRIWSTGLVTDYTNNQQTYLESPCISLANLDKPVLRFNYWSDSENSIDGTSLFYSTDDGKTWKLLGNVGQGLEWYNASNVFTAPGGVENNPSRTAWSGKSNAWKTGIYPLDAVKMEANNKSVRFRFYFASNDGNPSGTWDGFAMDNFFVGNREGRVLVEHFTTLSSLAANVRAENDSLSKIIDEKGVEIVALQYHTDFLGNNPLYLQNTSDPSARSLFYKYNQIPRASVDGKTNLTQTFSQWGRSEIDKRILLKPIFDVTIEFPSQPSNKFNVRVIVTAKSAYNQPVALHAVLFEKEVSASQLGLTGSDVYKNVVRRMLPIPAGKITNRTWNIGDTEVIEYSLELYDLPPNQNNNINFYNWANLSVAAFIQDEANKEVFQAAINTPNILPPLVVGIDEEKVGRLFLYPNPTHDKVYVGFESQLPRKYQWEIFNLQGQKVRAGWIEEGTKGVEINITDLPKGTYVVKIIHPTNKSVWIEKLIIH